jgi:hypothetical protein
MDEACEEVPSDTNWPSVPASRINWTDGAILMVTAFEVAGNAITAYARFAGSILRSHSNYIGERERFARDAGMSIEAMVNDHA